MLFPTTGYIRFTKTGYLPTDLSNCQGRHIRQGSKYGIYLNEDLDIAECQIAAYKLCCEDKLKEIYEKQEKHNYSCVSTYPNAPFIFFKIKN